MSYMLKRYDFKHIKFPNAAEPLPPPMELPICQEMEICRDCPYPSTGFQCRRKGEEECMRTRVREILMRRKTT